jgi:leucyl-tRNA synthetase
MSANEKELQYARHYTIKAVTIDAEKFQFNTSVARLMELLNAINKYQAACTGMYHPVYFDTVKDLVLLTAPFAPHFAEEMWNRLGFGFSIFGQAWPLHDEKSLVKDEIEIAVQINGAIKHRISIPASATQDMVRETVTSDPLVSGLLEGKEIVKFIYVQGRLANIVVK